MHSTIIKLKNYKETKNLTNKTLSEVLSVNEVTVSAWLRGINTPRAETLNMIEKFLENQNQPKSTSVQGKREIVKLTDFEDILSALQNGETLIANEYRFAFENGVLVKRNSKGYIVHINPALCLDIPYFVERKIPLKLEVGKRYKDNSGKTWVIYRESGDLFNGIQEHSGEQADFKENGINLCGDTTMDLVEEI
jgi:transcriptional regulator with XRE-family HTH domain